MSTTSVVMLGLTWDHPMVPVHLQPIVKKGLTEVEAEMVEAGYKYGFVMVAPEAGVAGVGEKIKSHSPDVVIVGNGIRGNPDLTPFFEQLVEVVRTSVPQAKFAFNTLPDNSVAAVKRVYPGAPKSA